MRGGRPTKCEWAPTFIAGNDHDFNERANDSDIDENKLVMTVSVGVQESNRNDLTSSKRGFPGSPRQDFQVCEDSQDREMCSTMVKNQQEEEKIGLQKEKKSFLDHKQGNKIIHI